ncbi:MAG: DUF4912 domain-containing protein [Planctomycetales bacterium]|nr:DUF4912 domain-containing protein [Planctomycetales bacterium]
MITAASLKEHTSKDLAQIAKKRGISGWHSMRKADLIKAIVRDEKKSSASNGSKAKSAGSRKKTAPAAKARRSKASEATKKPQNTRVSRQLQRAHQEREQLKDLSKTSPAQPNSTKTGRDRLVLLVRDAYWLHAHWELTDRSIRRARAAMAEQWHTAKPILRIFQVATDVANMAVESHLRDIEIHGGVNNWYIDVSNPPNGYRVELGYLAANGRFHVIARSNSVATPTPGSSDAIDENWQDVAENCEKIFAMSTTTMDSDGTIAPSDIQELFEERLRRPMGSPMGNRFGVSDLDVRENDFQLHVDAEMIIYGKTHSDAHVTLGTEPIRLRPDGTFTVRLSMPDRRQVLPVVASSRDGVKQQTIVLAVERNTKVMEPFVRDANEQ